MNQAMYSLVILAAIGGIGDVAYSWGYLSGGSISWAAAGWYREYPMARPAFLVGSLILVLILVLILDWHFHTYRTNR